MEFLNWINGLNEGQKKMLLTILGVIAVIGPILLILGKKSLFDFSFFLLLGRSEKFLNAEKKIFDDFKKPFLTKRMF